MYYTGINPLDMKPVYVCTDYHEKQLQRALLQYNRPENAPLVREALIKAGREDLIGFGEECLVRPARGQGQGQGAKPRTNAPQGKSAQGKSAAQRNGAGRKNDNKSGGRKTEKSAAPVAQKPSKPTYKKGWAKPKAKKKK